MIDLGLLRENPEYVKQQIHKKDPDFDMDTLIDLDRKVRILQSDVEALRGEKNELARQGKKGVTQELKERSRTVSQALKTKEAEYHDTQDAFKTLYLHCPNVLRDEVPCGTADDNKVIKVVGQKPSFSFTPKHHVELGSHNKWFDFAASAQMSGHNFAFYKNQGARVLYNLMMFMVNNNIKHGYDLCLPPYLVNEQSLVGSGNLPRFKEDVYKVEGDDMYLTPTAEVNLANIYRNAILSGSDLPLKMTSWTSCFRKEAGGYGAHERGLIRLHQFEKVELYTICKPENSLHELDNMISCAESILQTLGLHYRVSLLAGQDTGFSASQTYDIEVWMPGQREYKEVSSSSVCDAFQARRCKIRYKEQENDKPQLVHTLNASSLALPRLMVALMETYQQEDGTIKLPDALHHVMCPSLGT
jgi:seryl-tRNA synthetase